MSVGPWTGSPIVLQANQPTDRFYLGGARIAEFRGIELSGDHVPEDWVGSTTTVAGSVQAGLTMLRHGTSLRTAIVKNPLLWLGKDHVDRFGADPALLVKLLDAGERLPVHVHPDDTFARSHLGCRTGKTESWIVLRAEPGAQVHLGFREDVDPDVLADWVKRQDRSALLSALHGIGVAAGDTVFVPAGLPHAIGAGIFLLELQQAADLSLLLEYDGFAVDGPREGHLGIGFDAALSCVRHQAVSAKMLAELCGDVKAARIFPAQADAFFRADRHTGSDSSVWEPGFAIVVVVSGSGRLTWAEDRSCELRRGMTVVLPWNAGPMRVDGPVELIRCRPPAA
jgi:mannose-6-phosphate isomerase